MTERILRDHQLWVRVTSYQYGQVWRASEELGLSMSRLAELCLDKYFDQMVKDMKEEVKIVAKKRYK